MTGQRKGTSFVIQQRVTEKTKLHPGEIIIFTLVILLLAAGTYCRNRVWNSEIDLLTDCVKKSPNKDRPHHNLGCALTRQGKYQEAIDQYKEALRIKPDHAEAHHNLGSALTREGKYQEAIDQYKKALQIKPDYAEAHHNLGTALTEQGKYQEAIDQYKEALRIKPNSKEVYNNLAWLLATAKTPRFRDGKKALELSVKACELSEWKIPDYLDTLAAAYARVGEFNSAIKWQEKALESPQFTKNKEAQQRLNLYRNRKAWPPD